MVRNSWWLIARHELRTVLKDRYFRIILVFFLVLTVVSTTLGSLQVHQKLSVYFDSVRVLKSMGKLTVPPPPDVNPLSVSKDFVNYISMLGALLAILVGWNSVRNEKEGNLLALILSRPVYRDNLILGKIIGNGLLLGLVTALSFGLVTGLMLLLSGGSPSGMQLARELSFFAGVWLYLMVFASLAQLVTIAFSDTRAALLFVIIVWMVFTFILPQIGDTMDLDNQIPGGFFSYLGLNKSQEQQLLSHFAWYEHVRDGIEELSPTKHFERLSFALLNIKPGFENYTALQVLSSKAVNVFTLLLTPGVFIISTVLVFLRREAANR